jgi:hypothetical protein
MVRLSYNLDINIKENVNQAEVNRLFQDFSTKRICGFEVVCHRTRRRCGEMVKQDNKIKGV